MLARVADQGIQVRDLELWRYSRRQSNAGEVTKGRSPERCLPFPEHLVHLRSHPARSGRSRLKNGVSKVGEGDGALPQSPLGIKPLNVTAANGRPAAACPTVMVGDAPLENPAATYGRCGPTTFVRNGGDGYAMFKDCR